MSTGVTSTPVSSLESWPEISLNDAISKVIDNRGKSVPLAAVGVPLIATNCIKEDGLYPAYENVRYVSDEVHKSWFRGHPEPGDIILVNKGTPGRACKVPDPIDFCIAQDMVAIRANQQRVTTDYLFAAIRSPAFKEQVERLHVGTMIPHLKKSDFGHLRIPLPPRKVQEVIGSIYVDLSEKIELNRRMNGTLETLAQKLFKSWFVDFEPVLAKSQGRKPFGLADDVAALFPDAFEDSELGAIPKGWRIDGLGAIARAGRESVSPSAVDPELPYFGLEHFERKHLMISAYGNARDVASGKLRCTEGDLLFGKLRPYFHKVALAPADGVSSTDIMVIKPVEHQWRGFLIHHIFSEDFIDHADACSGGTRMPRTEWRDVVGYKVALPSKELVARFTEIVEPFYTRMFANTAASQKLAALRDLLLPKLLSGEIRVPIAETIPKETVT